MTSKTGLPEIVARAIAKPVINIGQLTDTEIRTLNRYAKRGWLAKGKGGPFPNLKTMWAHPGFDFVRDRNEEIGIAMAFAHMDTIRRQRLADTENNYGT